MFWRYRVGFFDAFFDGTAYHHSTVIAQALRNDLLSGQSIALALQCRFDLGDQRLIIREKDAAGHRIMLCL